LYTDKEGDLTLVLTDASSDDPALWEEDARFSLTVCSQKLDKVLPGWRNRITQISDSGVPGHLPIAELAKDTPMEFQHLIAAAHFSPTESSPVFGIEYAPSIWEVHKIAMLSHQYKALHLIAGDVPGWVKFFFPTGWKLESSNEYRGQLEYLWIAYEFGLEKMFHHVW
jgi:hypothetical protein